jgi:hypothetical protein
MAGLKLFGKKIKDNDYRVEVTVRGLKSQEEADNLTKKIRELTDEFFGEKGQTTYM